MIGLDVTHQALFTLADAERLRSLATRTGAVFADLLRYFARFHADRYGWEGSPIHDAVAVAHVLDLGLVETRSARVEVETGDESSRGRTIVELVDPADQERLAPNAEVGVRIDRERFVELLVAAVAAFP